MSISLFALLTSKMRLLAPLLTAAGAVLATITVVDLSWRAAAAALVLFAAAFAVHRRLPMFWWLGALFLLVCFVQAIADIFRGPQTPLAIMCSVLTMLLTALIASWWSRQRKHFSRRRRHEV